MNYILSYKLFEEHRGIRGNITIDQLWGLFKSEKLDELPVECLTDIIEQNIMHKSPTTLSFYNMDKGYNLTHDKTIRLSNHWNWKYKKLWPGTEDKVHSKTDIHVERNKWAIGQYDKSTDTYNILKIYNDVKLIKNHRNKSGKIIYDKMHEKKRLVKQLKHNPEIIEKRRKLKSKIDDGRLKCRIDDHEFIVTGVKKNNGNLIITSDDLNRRYNDKMTFLLDDELYTDFAEIYC